jgi:hypothetical protein
MRATRPSTARTRTPPVSGRLRREEKTIRLMIALYCRHHHGDSGRAPGAEPSDAELCAECAALAAYAHLRLAHCRFGHGKPTCARCTIHCYQKDMRERVRVVMRYSGPRMATRHPLLAMAHLLDRRYTPEAR